MVENIVGDSSNVAILLAAIIGLLLIAIFIFFKRGKSGRRDCLLTGLSEAGKTAIFMQLLYETYPQTLTSIKENSGIYKSGAFAMRIVDIPGHNRVRDKCVEKYKHKAKGIIFVIDSVTCQKNIKDEADALYTVLSDKALLYCPILIVCNKQDQSTAKSSHVIKNILEKEINIVRDTRSRKLQTLGEENTNNFIYLGKKDKDFEFAHISQNVQFSECSVKNGDLKSLKDWILSLK